MAYSSPNNPPRTPRMGTPKAPDVVEEFIPPLMEYDNPPVAQEAPSVNSPQTKAGKMATTEEKTEVAQADPTNAAKVSDPDSLSEELSAAPKRKGAGRPKGSKSAPKQEPAPRKKETRSKKDANEANEGKVRATAYLHPKDHKRLKMMCVDNDLAITDFLEDACLDVMYSSYHCQDPACDCEFVIRRTLDDISPSCPMCGGKKLDRPYLP